MTDQIDNFVSNIPQSMSISPPTMPAAPAMPTYEQPAYS